MHTITSKEFNQKASSLKSIAAKEPVVITERGRPAHVLLSYEAYLRLRGESPKIADLLGMPAADALDDFLRPSRELSHSADLV